MTGLDYFEARYYSGAQGRFTSPDPGGAGANPTDPQTWNAYAYVDDDPLSKIDPSGLNEIDIRFQPDLGSLIGHSTTVNGAQELRAFGLFGVTGHDLIACPNNICGGVRNASHFQFGGDATGSRYYTYYTKVSVTVNGVEYPPVITLFRELIPDSAVTAGGPANNGPNRSPISVGYTANLILVPSWLYGLGPAFAYTKIPSLNLTCVGGGLGVSAGHNFSFGPAVVSTQSARDILSGWSLSGGYNATPLSGAGGSGNFSGAAGGNTFGIPGASASLAWSKCW